MNTIELILIFCIGLIPHAATQKTNSFQIRLLGCWGWGYPIGIALFIFLKETPVITLQSASIIPFMACACHMLIRTSIKNSENKRINQFFWTSIMITSIILIIEAKNAISFLRTYQLNEIKTCLTDLMIEIVSYGLTVLCLIKHRQREFKKT